MNTVRIWECDWESAHVFGPLFADPDVAANPMRPAGEATAIRTRKSPTDMTADCAAPGGHTVRALFYGIFA